MHFSEFIYSISTGHPLALYLLIFLGVLIEGELALLIAGVLTHLGVFDFEIIAPLVFVAALSKTVYGYIIGEYIKKRFPKSRALQYIERQVLSFLPNISAKPFWSIFLSKFIYGVNHLTLIFAGYLGVNFKKYFWAEFFSSILWVVGIFILGFGFSYAAFSITRDIRNVSIIILLGIIGFFLLSKCVRIVVVMIEDYTRDRTL